MSGKINSRKKQAGKKQKEKKHVSYYYMIFSFLFLFSMISLQIYIQITGITLHPLYKYAIWTVMLLMVCFLMFSFTSEGSK